MTSTTNKKEEDNKILKDLFSEFDLNEFNKDSNTKLVGENHSTIVTVRSIVKDKKINSFVHERIKTAQDNKEIKTLMSERNKEIFKESFGKANGSVDDANYAGEDVIVFTLFTAEWFKWRSERLLKKLNNNVEDVKNELVNNERKFRTALMVAKAEKTIFSKFQTSNVIDTIKKDQLSSDKEELAKLIKSLQNEFNDILNYDHDSLVNYLSKSSYQVLQKDYMEKVCLRCHKYAELIDSDQNAKQFSQGMHCLNRLRESTMVKYIMDAIERKVPIIGYGEHHVKALKLSGIFAAQIKNKELVIYEDMTSFLKVYEKQPEEISEG